MIICIAPVATTVNTMSPLNRRGEVEKTTHTRSHCHVLNSKTRPTDHSDRNTYNGWGIEFVHCYPSPENNARTGIRCGTTHLFCARNSIARPGEVSIRQAGGLPR